jgi:YidC/Oxa1 family membrane protein insertase
VSFWRSFRSYRQFQRLPPEQRRLVFYSEGRADWPHLEPLIRELAADGTPIAYLTSSMDDPGLGSDLVTAAFIGTGMMRTILFRTMAAGVLVMTMPDLEMFHLKKSVHPVHYAYVFHAINSAHMIYPSHSFDAYDTILCCGPHHVRELRELEKLNGLKARRLVEHGYGRLDTLIAANASAAESYRPANPARVLLAPTWSENGIVELCARELIEVLLRAGLNVIFRPHPMSRRQSADKLDAIASAFSGHPNFVFDDNIAAHASLTASDIMITDWSGIAFEYAFALMKPILFIDVEPKVRNPDYRKISSSPLEVALRAELGGVLTVDEITDAPARIEALVSAERPHRERLQALRSQWVFNVGASAQAGAAAIRDILPADPHFSLLGSTRKT